MGLVQWAVAAVLVFWAAVACWLLVYGAVWRIWGPGSKNGWVNRRR